MYAGTDVMRTEQIYGSCVDVGGKGVLLRGPSGAGKSDLALRLIDEGAALVADDRVDLTLEGDNVIATAPSPLAGLIEVRGIGIMPAPRVAERAALRLIVDLVEANAVERLPEVEHETVLGCSIRRLALDPFPAAATAKIRLALIADPRDMLREK